MKTLKIFLTIAILSVFAVSCTQNIAKQRAVDPTRVAVIYTSDNANSITGAAILGVKYARTTFIDIDNMDSIAINTAINAIDSVHKAFVLVDTAIKWATNKINGYEFDTIAKFFYADTTYGVAPEDTATLLAATATENLAEVVWELCYPSLTKPKVVEYLGNNVFSSLVSRSKKFNTDSTAVDSTNTLVADAYDDDWSFIYDGTGIGQYRQVYDNTTTAFYVSPDWDEQPDETSLFKIKNDDEEDEAFYDMYTYFFVVTYLGDVSDQMDNWHKLLDKNYRINDGNKKDYQDLDYLQDVLDAGKYVFDYGVWQDDY
jgi:hypothetical protein